MNNPTKQSVSPNKVIAAMIAYGWTPDIEKLLVVSKMETTTVEPN